MSSSGTMQASILHGIEDLRLEETPIPEPSTGEIVVKVNTALTCGTDVKMFRRGYAGVTPPVPFGHEWSGVVARVGGGVTRFAEGMRVVAANSAPCGECFYCKVGQLSLCENLSFLMGAYAEYVRVPARIVAKNTFEIPASLRFEDAALLEPLACVVHGIERSGIELGHTVAINGAGPIGLMFCQLAKAKGARVLMCDVAPARLAIAARVGADEIIRADQVDQVEAVRQSTDGGRGADVAIECAGLPAVWEKTIEMVRPGGIANLFGGPPSGTTISVAAHRLHYEEITIKAVFHHTPHTILTSLRLLINGLISADTYVSERVGLNRVEESLRKMMSGDVIKVAVDPTL